MIRDTPAGVEVNLRVIPRAKHTAIQGERDGALVVRVAAPPVEGAANEAVTGCLAEALGVSRRSIAVVAGERSRRKRVVIGGLRAADLRRRLGL